jgi:hypothetical protein
MIPGGDFARIMLPLDGACASIVPECSSGPGSQNSVPRTTQAGASKRAKSSYAIVKENGDDLADRWQEALLLRTLVRNLWDRIHDRSDGTVAA